MYGWLIFIAIVLYLGYLAKKNHTKNIPEPFGIPFFGMLFDLYGMDTKKAYKMTRKMFNNTFKIAKANMTPFAGVVLVQDPEYLKLLLNNFDALNKGYMYKFLDWDRSLVSVDVDEWRPLRKHFNRGFTISTLKTFVGIFDKNSIKVVKNLDKHVGKGEFCVLNYILQAALDNICETSIGVTFEDEGKLQDIVDNIKHFHQLAISQMFAIHHWIPLISFFTPTYWKKYQHGKKVNDLLHKLVKTRIEQDQNSEKKENKEITIFMDQLMSMNKLEGTNFTENDFVENTNLLIAASLFTNSLLISLITILLAIHTDIQDLVRQEILTRFPPNDSEITYDKLSNLPYMDMVVKEALRLAPSVGNMIHKARKDIELEPGIVIPKDMDIIISPIALHRRKDIWGEDAEEFRPERFSQEESSKRHPYSYIPFSAGPRNCLGYRYASLVIRTTMVNLFRNFNFSTPYKMEDLEFECDASLNLTKPYLITVTRIGQENNNNNIDIKGSPTENLMDMRKKWYATEMLEMSSNQN